MDGTQQQSKFATSYPDYTYSIYRVSQNWNKIDMLIDFAQLHKIDKKLVKRLLGLVSSVCTKWVGHHLRTTGKIVIILKSSVKNESTADNAVVHITAIFPSRDKKKMTTFFDK